MLLGLPGDCNQLPMGSKIEWVPKLSASVNSLKLGDHLQIHTARGAASLAEKLMASLFMESRFE